MRHSLTIDGYAYRLRPIEDGDADLVLKLRGNPLLNRYLHAGSASVAEQLAWFARYYERPGDYYFVVERLQDQGSEGLIALYDLDEVSRSAEWGRWIIKPGSSSAVESAWLIYRCAFELLDLSSLYCRTVADNAAVVSFHDSCGVLMRRSLPGHFELGGQRFDAVEHRVHRSVWPDIDAKLDKLARLNAKRVNRA